jgi:hypothetical protein
VFSSLNETPADKKKPATSNKSAGRSLVGSSGPATCSTSNEAPQPARAPLQRLPQNLKEQLQFQQRAESSPSKRNGGSAGGGGVPSGKPHLQQVLRSNSSKWMRPKGSTPEKKDMKSLLERQLGTMRYRIAAQAHL